MIDITVEKVIEHPDGTMTIALEMTEAMLMQLAKVGLMHLIERAASVEPPDVNRDDELFGEIPEL